MVLEATCHVQRRDAAHGVGPCRRHRTRGRGPLAIALRGVRLCRRCAHAGTDKAHGEIIYPADYFQYMDHFLQHTGAKLFLATDSPRFIKEVAARYGKRVGYLSCLRAESNVAWDSSRDGYTKGKEVLLDAICLSKCHFMLFSFSGVPEFALRLNPKLHNNSVNFNYDPKTQFGHWSQVDGEWCRDLGPLAGRIAPGAAPLCAKPPAALDRPWAHGWAKGITKLSQLLNMPTHRYNDYNDQWMAHYAIRRAAPEWLGKINGLTWQSRERPPEGNG